MSGCSCVYADDGGGCLEYVGRSVVKARKVHRCGECGRDILPGESYETTSGKCDGEFHRFKTCLGCRDLRRHFFCDGFIYSQVISDLFDHLKDNGDAVCCLDGLSPEALAVWTRSLEPDLMDWAANEEAA